MSQSNKRYYSKSKPEILQTFEDVTPLNQSLGQLQQDYQIANLHEHSTNQKSQNPELQVEELRYIQQQQCKGCKYNLNEQSQLWRLPYEMLPISQQQSAWNEFGSSQQILRKGQNRKLLDPFVIDKQVIKLQNGENVQLHKHQNQKKQRKPVFKKIRHKRINETQNNFTCRCKKTHCLKSYCECYFNNVGCSEKCECVNCGNQMDPKKQIKKPRNFKKQEKEQKSCHCKKTYCLKNYCQCFHSGLACGINCNCQNCKNIQAPA